MKPTVNRRGGFEIRSAEASDVSAALSESIRAHRCAAGEPGEVAQSIAWRARLQLLSRGVSASLDDLLSHAKWLLKREES
jgi:hypothetical protein